MRRETASLTESVICAGSRVIGSAGSGKRYSYWAAAFCPPPDDAAVWGGFLHPQASSKTSSTAIANQLDVRMTHLHAHSSNFRGGSVASRRNTSARPHKA